MVEMIVRCFTGGVGLAAIFAGAGLFCWLMGRAWKRVLGQKKELEEAREGRRHPLAEASGRAKAAWVVLCLEQVLRHFGGAPEDWQWVLERLWGLTEKKETIFRDIFAVCCLLPVNVLPYERLADAKPDTLEPELADIWDNRMPFTEAEFQRLRALYMDLGWRLCVVDPVLQGVYKTAAASWVGERSFDGLAEEWLSQAEGVLTGWNITLPDKAALEFLRRQKGPGWGKAFDGRRWSVMLEG